MNFDLLDQVDDRYKNLVHNYMTTLSQNRVPLIFDDIHLSMHIGLDKFELYSILQNIETLHYSMFQIPKKNGGFRDISKPSLKLKVAQKWILYNILYSKKAHPCSHGFEIKKSIKTNAICHIKQDIVLSIDIKDFFNSITDDMVFKLFKEFGYWDEVADSLTKICCYKNCLPQGSPASPYIANLILYDLDIDIYNLCSARNWNYSRYADDITVSGDSLDVNYILEELTSILLKYHLNINHKKTRYAYNYQRQVVTGVVVNDKVNLSKNFRNKLRQEIYYINKYGLDYHLEHSSENLMLRSNYKEHLYGKVHLLNMFDEKKAKEYLKILNSINW